MHTPVNAIIRLTISAVAFLLILVTISLLLKMKDHLRRCRPLQYINCTFKEHWNKFATFSCDERHTKRERRFNKFHLISNF